MSQPLDRNRSYRDWLRREFEKRSNRNPLYSLRSFARDLKVSPSLLSEVLNGRHGLSLRSGERVCERLGLTGSEKERFLDLIAAEQGKSLRRRSEAQARLARRQADYTQLSLDHYAVISDWYHFAIMELTRMRGFKSDPAWIAKKLGIPKVSAEAAIERLLRLEILESRGGRLAAVKDFVASPDGVPSEAIRNAHEGVLGRAGQALNTQSVSERSFSAVILAFDRAEIAEANAMIREFRREFDRRFAAKKEKDSVYCLAIQFFGLTAAGREKIQKEKGMGK